MARAIVRDPNCFLFDEPLSRLDVELRQTMRGQIKEVLTGLSKATVIVTHDQLEALTMADRIAIMRDGLIEQIALAARDLRQARQRLRRELHRHAADEPDGGDAHRRRGNEAELGFGDRRFRITVDRAAAALPKGSRVTFGVRPRAFTLAGAASERTISGAVEIIEPMGAETLIHVRVGDARYARGRAARDPRPARVMSSISPPIRAR